MPFPTNGSGSIGGFGLALDNGICTVTTNMVTNRGDIANLVDGVDGINDLRPFTRTTAWAPKATYGATADEGMTFDTLTPIGFSGNYNRYIQWDFGEATSVGVMRFRATTEADFGVWQLYASQDGVTFTAEGNPVHLGGASLTNDAGAYDTSANIQLSAGSPYLVVAGNGFTAMPNRIYASDVTPQVYFINTKFYRYFRLVGISTFIPSSPLEGGGSTGLPPFEIWCLDLTSSDIPGLVWQTPDTTTYGETNLVPPVPGGVASYIIVPPDSGPTPGPSPGSNWPNVSSGSGASPPAFAPPFSDFRSPYSRGNRGASFATAGGANVGNDLIVATPERVEPPHEYASIKSGINNNFSAGGGDGPYYDGTPPGFYHQFIFKEPVVLTAIMLLGEPNQDLDLWKIQGLNPITSSYEDLSSDQRILYPATDNSAYGRSVTIYCDKKVLSTNSYRMTRGGSNNSGANGRLAFELLFKIAGSFLEGGDRRTGKHAVVVTTDFTMVDENNTPVTPELLGYLVDGQIETYNGGNNGIYVPGGPQITFSGGLRFSGAQADGRYFQFFFARQVRVNWATVHINGNPDNSYELVVDGAPTRWGMWKWQASEDGITFVDVGSTFYLTDRSDDPLFDGSNNDPNYYGHWRLVKVSGALVPFAEWQEFRFSLDDLGEGTPLSLVGFFNDEDGLIINPPTLTEAGIPFSAVFRDDTTLTATPTLHFQKFIQGNFTDDAELDVYSELSPSMVAQVSNYQTGR